MKPSYGTATTVAYTFTLKDQRHVVVYDAPGKLFELLAKVIAELVSARLFDDSGDTYEVHDYLEFNRSADEIAAYREARGDAGTLGNHKRWHIARRRWEKDCEHCQKEGRLGIAK